MKNFLNKDIHFLLMFCSVAIGILFASCNNEDMGLPVITDVRNYAASPKDTIIDSAVAKEQWVVIEGQNLQNALKISFNGVPAEFKSTFLTPNSAVVKIPAIVFVLIDVNKLYTIEYVTSEGSTTFSFKLGPAAPVITAISDVFAQPNDSVYIYGKDLVLLKSFSYGGTPITAVTTNLSGTALGFLMPSPAPTSGDVVITTMSGVATFKILALPTITGISNENAVANDSVFVYGTYLKGIQSFSFGGTAITSYKSNSNGSSVGFVLPSSVQTGPVSITTAFGTASTVYNVNDLEHGLIANLQWDKSTDVYGHVGWNGGTASTSSASLNNANTWVALTPDFPTNNTIFAVLSTTVLNPDEGSAGNWPPIYQLHFDNQKWIAPANLGDPVENYALKFEVSIPKPWNGGALNIESSNNLFTFRWEPWQITATTTAAYKTKGWITVTVPFTEFREKDDKLGGGRGVSITKLSDLVDATGKTTCVMYMHNYGTSATATGFYGAFDNLRIVKIK